MRFLRPRSCDQPPGLASALPLLHRSRFPKDGGASPPTPVPTSTYGAGPAAGDLYRCSRRRIRAQWEGLGGFMNRLSGAAAAAVFALCLSPMAQGASDAAWITLDRNTAQQALIGFAAAGRPGALVIMDAGRPEALGTTAKDTDVVVARISVDDVEMLPGILHAARHRC